jgi:UDPglucose 6-dehydrogenase
MLAVNGERPRRMAGKVIAALGGSAVGKTVAILGLTFKPETDDLRDSPALGIIAGLVASGAKIVAHDPAGMDNARRILPEIGYAATPYAAATNADAAVLATDWQDYRGLDLLHLRSLMRRPVFIDLRNLYRGADMAAAGFTYRSVGRPTEDAG